VATFSDRKSKALAIFVLCVVMLVCFGMLYFVGDLARFQEAISVKEGRIALQSVGDPEQLDQVLKQYPLNRTLKLVALAKRDSVEMDISTRGLLTEAEPRELSKQIDLGASSRSELEAIDHDLKTAESNTTSFESRYVPLVKAERDKVEHDASVLERRADTLEKFIAMIDEQHADMKALISRITAARLEYYAAYEKRVALLLSEFGFYKVANGQIIFRLQSAADSYNAAAAKMAAAASRLEELDAERTTLKQSQLDRWKHLVRR
jgi:hypothetical protein